ncbi:contractile injection system tape measure protein [Sediminibacterium ginsengisoli]|uniref:Uncharacterized protein n=1 Tax=Sediminibacterium ginsengisoli TaxID=413434 RepID=A0A1T4PME6_9BACT|nr:contractile injection system tape measure protein [Sediminibacterium ginsengisoli]SJZ92662.1 hypothetical protein SAMN04488132_10697 [Sediminibacterium ginsengisoli]
MASQHFSINQQLFEIDFFSKAKAYELQDRISRLVNGPLPEQVNRYLESVIPEELLLKIDQIRLDIGEVNYENLEQELLTKFMDALMEEIAARLRMINDPGLSKQAGITVTHAYSGHADLLEYFLLTGSLPWWAEQATGIGSVLDILFKDHRTLLRELLLRIGRYEYVRQRIVNHFREDRIRNIIETLEPVEAEYIFGYHAQVTRLQQREQIVKTEIKIFEKEVWLFILNYLLADRGGEFNRKAFVKNNLMQIAARFNISYRELLLLFFKALKIELSQNTHETSLLRVIEELAMTDSDMAAPEITRPVIQDPEESDHDLRTVTGIIELLRYYFEHETLPEWADAYTREQLAAFLLQAAGKAPETLSELLFGRNAAETNAESIFELLGTAGTKELLWRILPAGKEISRIATTFEILQSGRPLVNASARSFAESIWKILLNVLISFGTSAVAGPVIIEAVIRGIKKQYDIQTEALAAHISEAMQEITRKRAGSIAGFENVKTAVQSYVESVRGQTAAVFNIDPEDAEDKYPRSTSLRDLLRFLLARGAMPWWAKQYSGYPAAALLRQLLAQTPYDALWIFQWAQLSPVAKKRFLQNIPEDLVLDVIRQLPAASHAVRLFRQAKMMTGVALPQPDPVLLLQVLWDELADQNYLTVSYTGFYTKLISRIAALPGYDAEQALTLLQRFAETWNGNEVVAELEQWLISFQQIAGSEQQKRKPYSTRHQKPGDAFILQEYLLSASVMTAIPAESNEVSIVREWLAAADVTTRTSIADKLFNSLLYYIENGRLIPGTTITDQGSLKILLARLMILAFYTDRNRLMKLLETSPANDRQLLAIVQLTGALKRSAGEQEKEVFLFLSSVVQQWIYPFDELYRAFTSAGDISMEMPAGKRRSGKRFPLDIGILPESHDPDQQDIDTVSINAVKAIAEDKDPRKESEVVNENDPPENISKQQLLALRSEDVYTAQLPAGIEKQLLQQNAAEDIPAARIAMFFLEKEDVAGLAELYDAAIAVLIYFLLWNRLPAKFARVSSSKENELLRELVRFAFRRNRQALRQIVHNDEYQPAAMTRLFAMVEQGAEMTDRELVSFLLPLKQEAFRRLLKQQDITVVIAYMQEQHADAAAAIALLSRGNISARETQKLLASDTTLIAISEYAEPWLFNQLMQQSNYQPVPQFQSLVQNMLHILEHAFTDSLVREKMIRLYKLYNLKMAAQQQSFNNSYDYFLAFFRFAGEYQSPVTTIWQQVLDHLSDTDRSGVNTGTAEEASMRRGLRFLLRQEQDMEVIRNDAYVQDRNGAAATENSASELDRIKEKIRGELLREKNREEEAEKKQAQEKLKERKTKLYIANAGLVILHPFFSTYFSRLGLLEKGQFPDPVKQERGVLLMQYLVTGRQEFEEHELALNKILCGMDPDTPVAVEITVTDEEQTLSDELFEVLKQQWSKMKNNSIQGIRASFLQREGALEETEDGWSLRVEQRGYDMLLQTLPWGYGFIKTSWMKKILTVEWI